MWSRKSRKQSIELSEDAERGAEQVKRLLPDTFSRLVVDAAIRVLRDVDDPSGEIYLPRRYGNW